MHFDNLGDAVVVPDKAIAALKDIRDIVDRVKLGNNAILNCKVIEGGGKADAELFRFSAKFGFRVSDNKKDFRFS